LCLALSPLPSSSGQFKMLLFVAVNFSSLQYALSSSSN
jgi:hypothetical protein